MTLARLHHLHDKKMEMEGMLEFVSAIFRVLNVDIGGKEMHLFFQEGVVEDCI